LEYNTWLLFRQVVDIILLNDFVSYNLFALSTLDILFPSPTNQSQSTNYGMLALRLSGGMALLLFNLWVKTSAHDVVKDYGWYWGDCFFSRGYLRKAEHIATPDQKPRSLSDHHQDNSNSIETSGPSLPPKKEEEKELQFDLVFDGIFEMAPHPMYSVGYAGYYGVSLLAFSYQVSHASITIHGYSHFRF
jgi:phosphatidylethanolamine N-methyltransferase